MCRVHKNMYQELAVNLKQVAQFEKNAVLSKRKINMLTAVCAHAVLSDENTILKIPPYKC